MNHWTRESINLAMDSDYLDMLYGVYPIVPNIKRELDTDKETIIRNLYESRRDIELIRVLLSLDIFPIKDSFVSFLKRYDKSVELNPNTVQRILSIIYSIPADLLIDKCKTPKETNRQIGPMFKNWLNRKTIGKEVFDNTDDFINYDGTAIFNSSDEAMKRFANSELGYTRDKGLDLIIKTKNIHSGSIKYIVGEAKFLSDFGGHQDAQMHDALTTMTSGFSDNVIPISVLDGVCYIRNNGKMYRLLNEYSDYAIMSSLLLGNFISYIEAL